MRRLLLALAVPLFLLGCGGGPNPSMDLPLIKDMMRDFAGAVVANDKDKIRSYILPNAGLTGSPLKAKDWDKPEGRESIMEGNRRDMRRLFKDSGIEKDQDVDRFLGALRMTVADAKNGTVYFDIAASQGHRAEKVTFRLVKTEKGWRILDYYREMQ
jgi:hypothetical protein